MSIQLFKAWVKRVRAVLALFSTFNLLLLVVPFVTPFQMMQTTDHFWHFRSGCRGRSEFRRSCSSNRAIFTLFYNEKNEVTVLKITHVIHAAATQRVDLHAKKTLTNAIDCETWLLFSVGKKKTDECCRLWNIDSSTWFFLTNSELEHMI